VLSGTLAVFKSWAVNNPEPAEDAAQKLGLRPDLLACWGACATVRQVHSYETSAMLHAAHCFNRRLMIALCRLTPPGRPGLYDGVCACCRLQKWRLRRSGEGSWQRMSSSTWRMPSMSCTNPDRQQLGYYFQSQWVEGKQTVASKCMCRTAIEARLLHRNMHTACTWIEVLMSQLKYRSCATSGPAGHRVTCKHWMPVTLDHIIDLNNAAPCDQTSPHRPKPLLHMLDTIP
jgi:hypothetical protein